MEEHNYNNKGNKGKNNGWDSDRAHRIAASVLAIIMIAGLTVYGVYWNIKAKKGAESNDIAYRRAFSDLLGHLDDTENYLLKAMASSTPERTSLMLEEAWRSSALAENSLSVLPINQGVLSDVSKYLVQVGDAAKSWNAKTVGGESIAEEDSETLTRLYGYAQDLNGAFEYMAYCVGSGCTWKDIEKYSSAVVDNADIAKEYAFLENFSVPFADYPSLIYDGPFSEHMKTREAGALPENEITAEKGIEVLRKIFDKEDLQSIRLAYENKSGSVETFCYEIKLERENGAAASDNVKKSDKSEDYYTAYADVTKRGGLLYSMIFYRDIEEPNLNADQAVEEGRKFLARAGFENMEPSYYTVEGGCVTANYCVKQDDVMYYPDMVKVCIALDDGTVTGIECERYINNHTDRATSSAKLSEEAAQKIIGKQLTVKSCKRAVIPNDFGGEYNTYEFTCDLDGRTVLVYIDCNTGEEREILILQEDENGVLAK